MPAFEINIRFMRDTDVTPYYSRAYYTAGALR